MWLRQVLDQDAMLKTLESADAMYSHIGNANYYNRLGELLIT